RLSRTAACPGRCLTGPACGPRRPSHHLAGPSGRASSDYVTQPPADAARDTPHQVDLDLENEVPATDACALDSQGLATAQAGRHSDADAFVRQRPTKGHRRGYHAVVHVLAHQSGCWRQRDFEIYEQVAGWVTRTAQSAESQLGVARTACRDVHVDHGCAAPYPAAPTGYAGRGHAVDRPLARDGARRTCASHRCLCCYTPGAAAYLADARPRHSHALDG